MVFDYAEQNGYLKILIRWNGKTWAWVGAWCPPIFWSLKKGTRTFNFRYNEPSCTTLGPPGRYDDPWEKNKQINTHPWFVFWQKIRNPTFLLIGPWNCFYRVLWYAECDGVTFVKILWFLSIFSIFQNKTTFLRLVTFDDKD